MTRYQPRGEKGEPGGATTKALRWDHAWHFRGAARGGAAEEWRKEGSWREARRLAGPCHSDQCPLSIIAVLTLGPGCHVILI